MNMIGHSLDVLDQENEWNAKSLFFLFFLTLQHNFQMQMFFVCVYVCECA